MFVCQNECAKVAPKIKCDSHRHKIRWMRTLCRNGFNALTFLLFSPHIFSFLFQSDHWSQGGYIYVYMRCSPLSTPSWHMYRYVILPLSLCTALYSYVTWLPKSWLILPLEIVWHNCQIDRYGYLNTKWWFPESMLVDLILITNVYLVCIVLTQNWKG